MMSSLLRKVGVELALPAILLALLYVLSASSTNFYFPPLAAVLEKFNGLWLGPRFAADVIPSFQRLMAGYVLACLAGIALGVPIGIYRPLRRAAEPVLEFFRAVPPVAMIPLLIVSMGFGDAMKITIIVAGAIWPILLNTVEGVKAADSVLDETCRTYQIKGISRLRHFIIPSAMPQIVVGMRLGLSIGIVLMVISEMFAAMDGLGSAIIYFQRSYEIPQMWSGVLMLGLFGFALSMVFRLFERRVLGWYYGMRDLEKRS
ncbi:MAG: ABC-type nitrate/sulfonate/bicarbonate transport system, permease component [Variovorax sp.]|nr:ABC-type nitrate/sulfonate/bicarbonate transport system, permease component [Variovorax sp.]